MIAVIAALPREIAGLVKVEKPDASLLQRGIYLYRLPNAIVVAGGMGAARATLAVDAAISRGLMTTLISAGLAGACLPLIHPGTVLEASVVVDANTGENWSSNCNEVAEHHVVLVTTDSIASVQEKSRLAASYGAAMVDMEAATVARLAAAHGLGFRAIKAVSDAHDFELESLGSFTGKHGSFRAGAFALHTALRPLSWRKAMELGKNSSRALAALDTRLREFTGAYDYR